MEPAAFQALAKQKKVCVLIPTYNNELTVGQVIRDVLEYTDQVIVVCDGATDTTPEILKQFPQVDLVSYLPNIG